MTNWTDIDTRFEGARRRFLISAENSDTIGRKAIQKCIQHFEKFLDDEDKRAPEIRKAAIDILASIRKFSNIETQLYERAAIGVIAYKSHRIAGTSESIREILEKFATPNPSLSDVHMVRVLWAGECAAEILDQAAHILDLRTASLSEFLQDSVEISATDILKAMQETAKGEVGDRLLDAILTAVVPPVAIVMQAIKALNALRENVNEVARSYRTRGPEDDMFEFSNHLKDQDALIESTIVAMSTTIDALVAMPDAHQSGS
ncbi:hypothetical protein Q1W73_09765 [Asticcacaulis sp. ZE23SCel15]|uniref:hypothetical protein n=1 Tax=Asticcacaulis sp. ZE23SCel15 TaxID=3059027 RepID=UPI00265DED3F|nr:hypothetical protein [Asticcacaulis sp. ZE23SCel15]WKL55988.1 hypothetical protein Q1W73_09765 [Asticcacaulis sp. ZE23SCel15]